MKNVWHIIIVILHAVRSSILCNEGIGDRVIAAKYISRYVMRERCLVIYNIIFSR